MRARAGGSNQERLLSAQDLAGGAATRLLVERPFRLLFTKRRLVRHTLDALTARLVAISSSFTPASAASRIYDYVYRRQGTLNLFIVMDVSRPWRRIKVTERRTA
jgi:hypothetical protein